MKDLRKAVNDMKAYSTGRASFASLTKALYCSALLILRHFIGGVFLTLTHLSKKHAFPVLRQVVDGFIRKSCIIRRLSGRVEFTPANEEGVFYDLKAEWV